jgi:hypothetical protein
VHGQLRGARLPTASWLLSTTSRCRVHERNARFSFNANSRIASSSPVIYPERYKGKGAGSFKGSPPDLSRRGLTHDA